MKKTLSALILLMTMIAIYPMKSTAATTAIAKPRLWVYGDSINYESYRYIKPVLGKNYTVGIGAFPGIAPCDMLTILNNQIAAAKPANNPKYMIVDTVGNSLTGCMIDPNTGTYYAPGTPEYYQKYAADITAFAARAAQLNIRLLFIAPPPMQAADSDIQSAIVADEVATGNPVTYLPSQAVGPSGVFVSSLPCMKGEGTTKGCLNGLIQVRSADGIHFCPAVMNFPNPCPVYSSGEKRWANAIGVAVGQTF